jgi:hypothetical protein
MRPCTLRIASAEKIIKATSLDDLLVEHAPWCMTAPAALPNHLKPPEKLQHEAEAPPPAQPAA